MPCRRMVLMPSVSGASSAIVDTTTCPLLSSIAPCWLGALSGERKDRKCRSCTKKIRTLFCRREKTDGVLMNAR